MLIAQSVRVLGFSPKLGSEGAKATERTMGEGRKAAAGINEYLAK